MLDYDKPCGSVAPITAAKRTTGNRLVEEIIRCNRPRGHTDNHSYSTLTAARVWEWTRADIVRSPLLNGSEIVNA